MAPYDEVETDLMSKQEIARWATVDEWSLAVLMSNNSNCKRQELMNGFASLTASKASYIISPGILCLVSQYHVMCYDIYIRDISTCF